MELNEVLIIVILAVSAVLVGIIVYMLLHKKDQPNDNQPPMDRPQIRFPAEDSLFREKFKREGATDGLYGDLNESPILARENPTATEVERKEPPAPKPRSQTGPSKHTAAAKRKRQRRRSNGNGGRIDIGGMGD